MKIIRPITSILCMCVLAFFVLCAAAQPNETESKRRTAVNRLTHTKDGGWRKEVYHLRPARCDVWVEVEEPPDDAELESILIRSEPILEDLAEETIVPDPQETDGTDQFANADKMVDPQDVEYLAIVIFCEVGADAQSDETRYMVGDIVLNRVADSRYPDSILDVLLEPYQFGLFHWTGVVWPERASYKCNAHAVERAREIAYNLLSDTRHSELYGKGYIYQDFRVQGQDNVWSDGICFGR